MQHQGIQNTQPTLSQKRVVNKWANWAVDFRGLELASIERQASKSEIMDKLADTGLERHRDAPEKSGVFFEEVV